MSSKHTQVSRKQERVETLALVTPVKLKVLLNVDNREKLTYNDIDHIRKEESVGLSICLRTLTASKWWEALQLWASLLSRYPDVLRFPTFPETCGTYSWELSVEEEEEEEEEEAEGGGYGENVTAPPTPPPPSPAPYEKSP